MFGLNEAQRRAVEYEGHALLIVAGAGTGKTTTLAARLSHLIERGADPSRLLLLTFSRRAAHELIARAARHADPNAAGRVWGGTFHAVAHRLLQQHAEVIGLRPGFTVLDAGDAVDLMGLVRVDLGFAKNGDRGDRRFPRKDTLQAIYSRVANAQAPLSDTLADFFPWCRGDLDPMREVFAEYAARKQATNVIDFDDLLLYWRALAVDPAGARLRAMFDHVLVDEVQDVNTVQGDILAAHCGPDLAAITAVGDDAQAIYGFRAATSDVMFGFPDRFDNCEVVTLEQNYRSIPPILHAANAMLDKAPQPYPRTLWTDRTGDRRPKLVRCDDEQTQANVICDAVLEEREKGVALHDQAVLFRTGHHSDGLEIELGRRNIPFVKFGGLKFLETAHVKDTLALLRILDNPTDELAWHRVFGLLEGVGPAWARRIADDLGVTARTDAALKTFLEHETLVPPAAVEHLEVLKQCLSDCIGPPDPPPATQIERLLPFLHVAFERAYPYNARTREGDVEAMVSMAGAHRTRGAFLADLAIDPPANTTDVGPPHLDDDWLVLSTIHSAKGGEWQSVYVIHASDGNIPSDMALGEPGGVDEERRLLYVAMTRARDNLTITYPQRFYHRRNGKDDAHSWGQPSRFVTGLSAVLDETVIERPVTIGDFAPVDGPTRVSTALSDLWSA
ncbi:MAG TPA: ATP-dependent helicase [Acidimicrobiales bacterium]|nr:ATP-dependent helicase [Acidimicrobiales bacterium]